MSDERGATVIDFETAVEAYIELKKEGPYKEEALELLVDEIINSTTISREDKSLLGELLGRVRQTKQYGDTKPINEIWNILTKYEGFKIQWTKVLADILLRRRKL